MTSRLPSLLALRAFECTARHLSYTKAAAELSVTIPALSQHVRTLENDLGQALFVRQGRSIALTPEGDRLFVAAREAFGLLQEGWSDLAERGASLKLTTGPSLMANWITPRLTALQKAVPGATVTFMTTFDALDLNARDADVAIRHGVNEDTGVHAEFLYRDWQAPLVAPSLAQHLKTPSDLLDLPLIESQDAREPREQVKIADWFRAVGVNETPQNYVRMTHTETAMQLARDGEGVKLCSNVLADEDLRTGRLVMPFKIGIQRKGIRYRFLCRNGDNSARHVKRLRRFLMEEFEAMHSHQMVAQADVIEIP